MKTLRNALMIAVLATSFASCGGGKEEAPAADSTAAATPAPETTPAPEAPAADTTHADTTAH